MINNLVLTMACLFAFGAILIGLHHQTRGVTGRQLKRDWLKYFTYALIISFIIYLAYFDKIFIIVILIVIAMGGSLEMYQNVKNYHSCPFLFLFITMIFLLLCLSHLVIESGKIWFTSFGYVFLLVSVTDSYSQLWGKLLGKHKLCPNLSPNKTWEGFLGGIVSAIAASFIFSFLMPGVGQLKRTVLALFISLSAIAGDLLFSYIKRKLSIKDFSDVLPGHGGILDRFDSLMLSAPVFYWFKIIIQ